MQTREAMQKYWNPIPPESVDGKSMEQLKAMVNTLEKEKEILNRELKSKQIVIDIKTKEAEKLNRVVKLLLDTAALASMVLNEGKIPQKTVDPGPQI